MAAATVVLAACQSAPPPPAPPTPTTPATGCHVGLLGDSLSMAVQSRMPAALTKQRCKQVWVDASIGRNTGQGVVALAERRAAGELPAVLVVGLGTNDQAHMKAFAGHVDSIMHLSAGRPVVWIEVAHAPIKDELNAVLRRKAAQWSNLTIMEWEQDYWDHAEWRSIDQVHLTDRGMDERARRIAVAAQRVAK
ncbi:MAG: hypothetical protein M3Y51_07900 [Actinomycetota bacterium]|nr:hypothetical protein [Actinomycetota bacterium]